MAAPTTTSAVPGIPTSCMAHWDAYSAAGHQYWYQYKGGTTSARRVSTNTLCWQPTAEQQMGAAGDSTTFQSTEIATSKGSKLMRVAIRGTVKGSSVPTPVGEDPEVERLVRDPRHVREQLPLPAARLDTHALHPSLGLHRRAGHRRGHAVATGLGGVRSIIYSRKASTSTGQVDVILANDTSGRLVEYRIPHNTPTKWTRTILKTSGFQYYRARTTSPCGTRGRTIGGITDGGRMFVYYDANRSNLSGSDIKGGNTGRTGLNLPAFGQ